MIPKNSTVSLASANTASRLAAEALLSFRKLTAVVRISSIVSRAKNPGGVLSASAILRIISSLGVILPFS